jgi:hypothetical protein
MIGRKLETTYNFRWFISSFEQGLLVLRDCGACAWSEVYAKTEFLLSETLFHHLCTILPLEWVIYLRKGLLTCFTATPS